MSMCEQVLANCNNCKYLNVNYPKMVKVFTVELQEVVMYFFPHINAIFNKFFEFKKLHN